MRSRCAECAGCTPDRLDGWARSTASADVARSGPRPRSDVGYSAWSHRREFAEDDEEVRGVWDAFRSTQMPDLWSDDRWQPSASARHFGGPRSLWHDRPRTRQRRSTAGAAVTHVQYPSRVRDVLGRYPGTSSPMTAGWCTTPRQQMSDGSDICVVFFGPHGTVAETCFGRGSGPVDAYVKPLEDSSGPNAASDW